MKFIKTEDCGILYTWWVYLDYHKDIVQTVKMSIIVDLSLNFMNYLSFGFYMFSSPVTSMLRKRQF